jgi:serine/threonine protein kinase
LAASLTFKTLTFQSRAGHNFSLAKDFLSRLLKKEGDDRYIAFEALQHPWLTDDSNAEIPLKVWEKVGIMYTSQKLKEVGMKL